VPFVLRRTGATLDLHVAGKSLALPAGYEPFFERPQRGQMTMLQVEALLPGDVGHSLVKMLLLEGLLSVD